jgi:3',5'-cyclic AMP phosphodiesterase CpdA
VAADDLVAVPLSRSSLFAVSDLHADHPENREIVERLRPESDGDWLIVCGDVADLPECVEWALRVLREHFANVIWVPGNHELLTHRDDPWQLRGERRYRRLVEMCRRIDVITPEDPYPTWDGRGGPMRLVPLFLLYDYTFGSNVGSTRAEALRRAYDAGVVCVDEFLLHSDPYPSREDWCAARVSDTERRLSEEGVAIPSVLINHFPLVVEPTHALRHPEFAQWCGTARTADWHRRFRAAAVVYGHLHIPRTTHYDGVRFEEVSLGYPHEWHRRCKPLYRLRQILPEVSRA